VRLIVTADDLGVGPDMDDGILAAADAGAITSASVLVGGPTADRLGRATELCLGLHLAFVQGRPVSEQPLPTLAPGGQFLPSALVLARSRIDPNELHVEAEAQVRRFVDLVGRLPAFVNTHQHTQLLPSVRRVLLRVCERWAIARVRLPAEQRPLVVGTRARSVLWPLATAVALASRGSLRRAGLRFPDRMMGGPSSGGLTVPRLKRLLKDLRHPTTELVVHPARGSSDLAALTDPAVVDLLKSLSAERIPFDAL